MPSTSNNNVTCLGVLPQNSNWQGEPADLSAIILEQITAPRGQSPTTEQEQLLESLREQIEGGIFEYQYHLGLANEALSIRELTALNPIIWQSSDPLDLESVSELVASINIAMLIDINQQVEQCLKAPCLEDLEKLQSNLLDLHDGSAPVFIFVDSESKLFLGKPHTPVCTALLNPLMDLAHAHQALKDLASTESMTTNDAALLERCTNEPYSISELEAEKLGSRQLKVGIQCYLHAWRSAQEITTNCLSTELNSRGEVNLFLDFPNWPSLSAYSNEVRSSELQYAVALETWRDALTGHLDDTEISASINYFRPKLRAKYAELQSLSSQLGIGPILTPQVVHASIWEESLMGGPLAQFMIVDHFEEMLDPVSDFPDESLPRTAHPDHRIIQITSQTKLSNLEQFVSSLGNTFALAQKLRFANSESHKSLANSLVEALQIGHPEITSLFLYDIGGEITLERSNFLKLDFQGTTFNDPLKKVLEVTIQFEHASAFVSLLEGAEFQNWLGEFIRFTGHGKGYTLMDFADLMQTIPLLNQKMSEADYKPCNPYVADNTKLYKVLAGNRDLLTSIYGEHLPIPELFFFISGLNSQGVKNFIGLINTRQIWVNAFSEDAQAAMNQLSFYDLASKIDRLRFDGDCPDFMQVADPEESEYAIGSQDLSSSSALLLTSRAWRAFLR